MAKVHGWIGSGNRKTTCQLISIPKGDRVTTHINGYDGVTCMNCINILKHRYDKQYNKGQRPYRYNTKKH